MLHDIGKIIFIIYFPDEYKELLKRAAMNTTPLHKLERETLGLDHAEMAYHLMEHWKFPADIVQPVRHHHNPSACPEGHMALMVNTADFIARKSGIGESWNKKMEKDHKVLSGLKLSHGSIVRLAEELESERAEIEGFLQALS